MSVYVFLHDTYADWEIGYILAELCSAAADPRIKKNRREVVTFSLTGKPVQSMGSLTVIPSTSLDAINQIDVDALILPGGLFWQTMNSPALDSFVTEAKNAGKVVAAACAATAYLARLGLLENVEHTSNSLEFLKMCAPNYKGNALYREKLAVVDKGIITASGLGAVDFADKLLRVLEVYDQRICDAWFDAYKNGVNPYANAEKKYYACNIDKTPLMANAREKEN